MQKICHVKEVRDTFLKYVSGSNGMLGCVIRLASWFDAKNNAFIVKNFCVPCFVPPEAQRSASRLDQDT